MKISRALISVSDKTGVADFCHALHGFGVELLSTGGSAQTLREAGLPVTEVSDYTGFPEMLDGRVKTLHPKVHGGILARRDLPEHLAALQKAGIPPIDLVVVNLYPFQQTIAQGRLHAGGSHREHRYRGADHGARCRQEPRRLCGGDRPR